MKYFIIIFTVFFWGAENAAGNIGPLSDSEALTAVLSTAVQLTLEQHNPVAGKTLSISYTSQIKPHKRARAAVEAVLTGFGCSITNSVVKADLKLVIAITGARIIIQPHKDGFIRTVSAIVHVKCLDSSNKILLASGREETLTEKIPSKFFESTDDGENFCKSIKRHVVERNNTNMRLISFVILTGILVYFAFQ